MHEWSCTHTHGGLSEGLMHVHGGSVKARLDGTLSAVHSPSATQVRQEKRKKWIQDKTVEGERVRQTKTVDTRGDRLGCERRQHNGETQKRIQAEKEHE